MATTLPLRYAQSLLRLAPWSKGELTEELKSLNLPLALLEDRVRTDATIAVEDYGKLFIHLVHRLQERLPNALTPPDDIRSFSAYRMMFQAMLHSRDLGQALQRASIYFRRLQSEGEGFELEDEGDQVVCRFTFNEGSERALASPENFSMEYLHWLPGVTGRILSMAMWHRVCGWFVGMYIGINSVEMTQVAETDKCYREIFGQPIKFGSERDSFSFPSRFLSFPIVQSEESLATMLATYPAELFSISPQEHSTAQRIRSLIGSDFQRQLPSLQDMADRLHMTTPTLHRRLREEDTSYQKLKDCCRRDTAIQHLSRGHYTTAELAEVMGFSDSSTFHRAFKKWTGLTPQDYRSKHF